MQPKLTAHSPPSRATVQSEGKNNHQIFKEVVAKSEQNPTFFSSLYKQFTKALIMLFVRPFRTIQSLISNKRNNDFYMDPVKIYDSLTSHAKDNCYFSINDYVTNDLSVHRMNDLATEKTFLFIQQIGCKLGRDTAEHLTFFVQGKTKEGKRFAMYYDPLGNNPYEHKRFDNQRFDNPDETVGQFLEKYLKKTSFDGVDILCLNEISQMSHIDSTAYCKLFTEKLIEAFKKDDFSPEDFMQKTADGEILSYSEARKTVFKTDHSDLPFPDKEPA